MKKIIIAISLAIGIAAFATCIAIWYSPLFQEPLPEKRRFFAIQLMEAPSGLFASTTRGAFRRVHDGTGWKRLEALPIGGRFEESHIDGSLLYIVWPIGASFGNDPDAEWGVFLSHDGGDSWQRILDESTLRRSPDARSFHLLDALLLPNGRIYVCFSWVEDGHCENDIWTTTDDGLLWKDVGGRQRFFCREICEIQFDGRSPEAVVVEGACGGGVCHWSSSEARGAWSLFDYESDDIAYFAWRDRVRRRRGPFTFESGAVTGFVEMHTKKLHGLRNMEAVARLAR